MPSKFVLVGILALPMAGCGLLPSLPTPGEPGLFVDFPVATFPAAFEGEFSMPPVWQAPDVPEDVLEPIAGAPPQWWNWVPIHPAPRTAAEYDGGFHYTVDVPASEMQEYYRDGLRQAGWEPRMEEFVTGEYSLFYVSRYGVSATVYVSPRDSGTIVSIVLD